LLEEVGVFLVDLDQVRPARRCASGRYGSDYDCRTFRGTRHRRSQAAGGARWHAARRRTGRRKPAAPCLDIRNQRQWRHASSRQRRRSPSPRRESPQSRPECPHRLIATQPVLCCPQRNRRFHGNPHERHILLQVRTERLVAIKGTLTLLLGRLLSTPRGSRHSLAWLSCPRLRQIILKITFSLYSTAS